MCHISWVVSRAVLKMQSWLLLAVSLQCDNTRSTWSIQKRLTSAYFRGTAATVQSRSTGRSFNRSWNGTSGCNHTWSCFRSLALYWSLIFPFLLMAILQSNWKLWGSFNEDWTVSLPGRQEQLSDCRKIQTGTVLTPEWISGSQNSCSWRVKSGLLFISS